MREKTRYTRKVQLSSAVANGDIECLADLLRNAEEAHAAWEQEGNQDASDWPAWYAAWLLGDRDSFESRCSKVAPDVVDNGYGQVGPANGYV